MFWKEFCLHAFIYFRFQLAFTDAASCKATCLSRAGSPTSRAARDARLAVSPGAGDSARGAGTGRNGALAQQRLLVARARSWEAPLQQPRCPPQPRRGSDGKAPETLPGEGRDARLPNSHPPSVSTCLCPRASPGAVTGPAKPSLPRWTSEPSLCQKAGRPAPACPCLTGVWTTPLISSFDCRSALKWWESWAR